MKRLLAIILLLLWSASVCRADITSNLVAHWKLDETSGTTAADSSGNGYNGTYVNSPTLNQTGAFGTSKAVLFASASSQKVTASPTVAAYPFTMSLWAKPTDTASQTELMEIKTTLGHIRIEQRADASLRIIRYDGTTNDFSLVKASVFAAGTWTHITLVCASSTSTVAYVNGGSPVSVSVSVNFTGATAATLASSSAGSPFNGTLDDVRIYDRAFSSGDVSLLYAYTGVKFGMRYYLQKSAYLKPCTRYFLPAKPEETLYALTP